MHAVSLVAASSRRVFLRCSLRFLSRPFSFSSDRDAKDDPPVPDDSSPRTRTSNKKQQEFKCRPIPSSSSSKKLSPSSSPAEEDGTAEHEDGAALSPFELAQFRHEQTVALAEQKRIFAVEAAPGQKKELPALIHVRLQIERLVQEGELLMIQEDEGELLKLLSKIDVLLDGVEFGDGGLAARVQLERGNAIKANLLVDFWMGLEFSGLERVREVAVVRRKAAMEREVEGEGPFIIGRGGLKGTGGRGTETDKKSSGRARKRTPGDADIEERD